MKSSTRFCLFMFVIFVLFCMGFDTNYESLRGLLWVLNVERTASWTLSMFGAIVVAVSMVLLLNQCWGRQTLDSMPSAFVPFLAGLTLLNPNSWAAMLAFGALGVALIARGWCVKDSEVEDS